MDRKIRVAAVSYLNTKPLTYGLESGDLNDKMDLSFEYPAKVAAMLMNGEADVGLVPVAIIPRLQEHYIISDFCIGASQEVASVCLFSEVPIAEVESIWLDYQSRSSVALLKLLLKRHWNVSPQLVPAEEGYEEKIKGKFAGLVIGDRALSQRKKSPYIYDLATAWQEMTGLPFVFATWISNKRLPDDFVSEFNRATSRGLDHIDEIVEKIDFPDYDMKHYYTANIDYRLDAKKRLAIDLFLEMLSTDE